MDERELCCLLKKRLSSKRFFHTMNVKKQAQQLARRYHADVEKAGLAALLHDITKEVDLDEQLKMLQEFAIIKDSVILETPNLYHAFSADIYIRRELGITDPEILDAVRYHTIARAGMSVLEKIVYIADATSEERDYKAVDRFRKLSQKDLDLCMFELLKYTIRYLVKEECLIPNDTIEAYHDYCRKMRIRKGRES